MRNWLIFQKKKKHGESLWLLLPSSVSLPVTATIKIKLLPHLNRRGLFRKDCVNTLWVYPTHTDAHTHLFLFNLIYNLFSLHSCHLKTLLHLSGTVLSRMGWSEILEFTHLIKKCFQWHEMFFAVIDTASKITISWIHWEACWKWFIQTAKIKTIWSHCQPFIWWPAPILCFYLQCWTLVKSPRVSLKVRLVWV